MRRVQPLVNPPKVERGTPPVLIISLRRTPERTLEAVERFRKTPLHADVLWATDGQDPDQLRECPRDPDTVIYNLQPGEVGLSMSWWRAAARIVHQGWPWAIVVEDDVRYHDLDDLLQSIRELPLNFHFALLHDAKEPRPVPAPGGHTRAFERMIECSWGTVAVLVSNEGARAILTQLPPFDRPIDVWLRANGRRFNIYQPRRGWFWQPFLKPSTVRAGKYTGDIPPLIHRIWIGSPIPLAFSDYWETWRHYHPQVFFHTWTDIEIIRVFGPRIAFAQTRAPVEMADFARLLILERFGGLYVDCDFECLRDCTPLMQTGAFIVATTSPGMPANGFMAATAGNAFVTTLVSEAKKRIMAGRPTLEAAGPQMVRDVLEASFITRHFPKPIRDDHRRTLGIAYGDTGIVALEPWVTFPYCWQAESPPADYGDAWAVHHWARSWWTTQQWNAHGKSFEMPSSRLRIRAC